jgi:hypothetical protein
MSHLIAAMAAHCSADNCVNSPLRLSSARQAPLGIRCALALLLTCAGWTADDADLKAMTRRVFVEAEALGLPSLEGATLYEGLLTPAGQEKNDRLAARSFRHVHAKRPDGTWLLDLLVATKTEDLDPAELSALRPFIPGSPEPEPPPGERYAAKPDTLGQARRIAVGVPEASAHFLPEDRWRHGFAYYPRQDRPRDPELALRLACRDYFLSHQAPAAALAIVPPAWRAAVRRRSEHHAPPDPLPAGAPGLVAGYQFPTGYHEAGVDEPLLPEVDDSTLVSLAADRTPALAGGTVGEIALYLLGERWGFDPALLAGRDPEGPWDDAEQDAVAHGLAAWWQRTAGMTLAQRWMAVLSTLPYEQAFAAIGRRESGMSDRRSTAHDRLHNPSWKGASSLVIPPFDYQDLLDELTSLTLARYERRATPPDDLTEERVLTLLTQVDGSRGFSGDTPAEVHGTLMKRANELEARFMPLVASWPRQGAAAVPLAMWDDEHGHPEVLDALVAARLAIPGISLQERRRTLQLWVRRCTAPRWPRLKEMLSHPSTDPDCQALIMLVADPYGERLPYSGTNGEDLMAWFLLQDQRPLPAAVLPTLLPHTPDSPLAMALTVRLARYLNPYNYPRPSAADLAAVQAIRRPSATPAVSAEANTALIRTYAVRAASLFSELKIELPPDISSATTTVATAVAPSGPHGLTPEEATAITAALAQARSFGFPDLTGAKVIVGLLPSTDGEWYGAHIRLASGSWLADGIHPVEHVDSGQLPNWVLPLENEMSWQRRLPAADRARLGQPNLGQLENVSDDVVLPALAWWQSGEDKDGHSLIAAVMREAVRRHDVADAWNIIPGRGGEERGALVALPPIPDGVRRSLARWFREQLVWPHDAAAATHAVTAITALLAPGDQSAWEPIIALLRARLDLPASAPTGADLAARLQSWKDSVADQHGHWPDPAPVPAIRADTAALMALLDDARPTRRVEAFALPHTLGDMALEALCELWHVDWRWLVVDDPLVAAILPPSDHLAEPDLRTDLGDEWVWSQTAWTPERRAAITAALARWWKAHGTAGESPTISAFRTLPFAMWAETLDSLPATEMADVRLGDVLAARLQTIAPLDPDGRMQHDAILGLLAAAIRFPAHPGLTAALAAWPAAPWLAGVAAIRSEYAGDAASFDRWLSAGFAHSLPPRHIDFDHLDATPWGCIGLWAHHPTAHRLESLRTMLKGSVDDPRMIYVLLHVGSTLWSWSLDLRHDGHSDFRSRRAQAIPCALALDCLRDQRLLGAATRAQLVQWSETQDLADLARKVPADARVCDWVAARLLSEDTVLPTNPHDANDALTFLAAPLAKRDASIVHLIQAVEQQVLPNLRAAGLAAPATPASAGAGASDF